MKTPARGRFAAWALVGVGACALFLAALLPQSLGACTCMSPGPPVEEMERATAVFSGRVVSLEPAPRPEDPPNWPSRLRVTVELLEAWKGVPEGSSVTLTTASQSAACGYTFEKSKRYLIYAYGEASALSATLCSRTAPLKQAKDDLAALGSPLRTVP